MADRIKTPARRMTGKLTVFCILVLWLLPLFSGIILSAAYELIVGDILYEGYDAWISAAISICDVFCIFAGYAVINFVFTTDLYGARIRFIVLQIISYLAVFACAVIIDKAFLPVGSIYLQPKVILRALTLLESLLLYALLLFVLHKKRKRTAEPSQKLFSAKDPRLSSALLIALFWLIPRLIAAVLDTVDLLVNYGAPTTVGDIVILLTPYMEGLLQTAFGYLISVGLLALFTAQYQKLQPTAVPTAEE